MRRTLFVRCIYSPKSAGDCKHVHEIRSSECTNGAGKQVNRTRRSAPPRPRGALRVGGGRLRRCTLSESSPLAQEHWFGFGTSFHTSFLILEKKSSTQSGPAPPSSHSRLQPRPYWFWDRIRLTNRTRERKEMIANNM